MRLRYFLPVLLLVAGALSWAAALRPLPVSDQVRADAGGAAGAYRATQVDGIPVDETAAGRRLTAAERAELREQVRQQWAPNAGTAVQAQPAARPSGDGPKGARPAGATVQPRSQRP